MVAAKGTVVWIVPFDSGIPDSPDGWDRIVVVPNAPLPPQLNRLDGVLSVIFQSSMISMIQYDPVVLARAVRSAIISSPVRVIGIISPVIEVHVATQHAIAHEVADVLGGTYSYTVTARTGATQQGKEKDSSQNRLTVDLPRAHKSREITDPVTGEAPTAARTALDIATGIQQGEPILQHAVNFVYAYTTNNHSRRPFRCSPLQRRILQELALGELVGTTTTIAMKVGYSEKKVGEAIADLVSHILPRQLGETDARDGLHRLNLLIHQYGAWIRMVDTRNRTEHS